VNGMAGLNYAVAARETSEYRATKSGIGQTARRGAERKSRKGAPSCKYPDEAVGRCQQRNNQSDEEVILKLDAEAPVSWSNSRRFLASKTRATTKQMFAK
jgi:hypothetical protein